MRLLALLSVPLGLSTLTQAAANWKAPNMEFLFSSNVSMSWFLDVGGAIATNSSRLILPINGGQFEGPKLTGRVLALGGDWAVTDIALWRVKCNARFNLRTTDGADIFVQMKGKGKLGLDQLIQTNAKFETATEAYSWLNDITAVVILKMTRFGYTMDMWRVIIPEES